MPTDDYILRGDAISEICRDCQVTEYCRMVGESCEDFKRIKAIPAADVAPVRHGRWKEHQTMVGYYLECSYCGVKSNMDRMLYAYRYCPHCGAKMDKEEEHE